MSYFELNEQYSTKGGKMKYQKPIVETLKLADLEKAVLEAACAGPVCKCQCQCQCQCQGQM